jgi:hypothetical protein
MLGRERRISRKLDPEVTAGLLLRSQDLELWSFRLLSTWLPKVQEWELKVELGRQIWEEAQHVDALWRLRTNLVRAAEPPAPNPRLSELTSIVGTDACTACFLVVLYGVVKPHLLETYQDQLGLVDVVADAPTVRLLKNIIRDETGQITWGEQAITRHGAQRLCGREEFKGKSMADYLTAGYGELV